MGLGREILPKEYPMVAETFSGGLWTYSFVSVSNGTDQDATEKPTPKAIQERLTKLRRAQMNMMTENGFFDQAEKLNEDEYGEVTEEHRAETENAGVEQMDVDKKDANALPSAPLSGPTSMLSTPRYQAQGSQGSSFTPINSLRGGNNSSSKKETTAPRSAAKNKTPLSSSSPDIPLAKATYLRIHHNSKKRKVATSAQDTTAEMQSADTGDTSALDILAQAAASSQMASPNTPTRYTDKTGEGKGEGTVDTTGLGFPNLE